METLTIDLFEPGMGPLHRAGLGGLAATIRWLNSPRPGGRVDPARRPAGTLAYDDRTVTLAWAAPARAGEFFRKLYELAFDLRDGMIHLPGSYGDALPSEEVKAALQDGMARTILQLGPNRKTEGPPKRRRYEVDGRFVEFQHQNLVGYTHRSAWKKLVTPKGALRPRVSVCGAIAPGFVQRHVAFPATTIKIPPGHAVALHFALVGTLSLSTGPKGGALIVPEVEDLETFAARRSALTPDGPQACRIRSPADAALQAMVRLRGGEERGLLEIRRCHAVLFTSQAWSDRQKTRAAVLEVEPGPSDLERFAVVLSELPPRLVEAQSDEAGGGPASFWVDSVVRPLVAENLARGRPWFEGFRNLIVGPDGKADESRARILGYERKGLRAMIDQPWEDRGEKKLVESIHDAMGRRFGAIKTETGYDYKTGANKDAYGRRRDGQMQKWRLELAGAKTPDDVRRALGDLWSRSVMSAPSNKVLKESWAEVLPLFCDERRWKINRDLALLALASYGGFKAKGEEKAEGPADDDVDDEP